jgi:hypothetical protein
MNACACACSCVVKSCPCKWGAGLSDAGVGWVKFWACASLLDCSCRVFVQGSCAPCLCFATLSLLSLDDGERGHGGSWRLALMVDGTRERALRADGQ